MSSTTKNSTSMEKKETVDNEVSRIESSESDNDNNHVEPESSGRWADTVREQEEDVVHNTIPTDSVANIDFDEVAAFENKVAKELNIDQMVKVLIRRGHVEFNPALKTGCQKLLRQLHCEPIHPKSGSFGRRERAPRFDDSQQRSESGEKRGKRFAGNGKRRYHPKKNLEKSQTPENTTTSK